MSNFSLELPYVVEAGDENRILCYIENDHLERLSSILPEEVIEVISSIGIAFKGSDVWFAKNHRLTPRDREDVVCRRFHDIFTSIWKWEYGIPCLRFSGNLKYFDNYFIDHTVFIHFLFEGCSISEQNAVWRNILSFNSNCTFIADLRTKGISHFNIFTTDHKVARSYLVGLETAIYKNTSNFERYDLNKILRDWEPDDVLRAELYAAANNAITDLIYIKKLNLLVPGFLFFTSINIRRFRRAQTILISKYNPRFVMTLPFSHKGRQYTVAFPICGKV